MAGFHRPDWVDGLLSELGRSLGLDLSFGEDGLFELSFDGTELGIFWKGSEGGIVVKSKLDLPLRLPSAILALLHRTNMDALQSGRGIVAIDLDHGAWVWTDRIDPAGLTAPLLRAALERAANAARDWANRVPDIVAEANRLSREAEAEADRGNQPTDTEIIFRM